MIIVPPSVTIIYSQNYKLLLEWFFFFFQSSVLLFLKVLAFIGINKYFCISLKFHWILSILTGVATSYLLADSPFTRVFLNSQAALASCGLYANLVVGELKWLYRLLSTKWWLGQWRELLTWESLTFLAYSIQKHTFLC